MFDISIVIGRFQPWTLAHHKLAEFAASKANNLGILCGSYSEERTKKNPLLFVERKAIIESNLKDIGKPFSIQPVPDCGTDDEWVKIVRQQIDICCQELYLPNSPKIALVGMKKDNSSYYLDLFPDLPLIEYDCPDVVISATDVREIMYGEKSGRLDDFISDVTKNHLYKYQNIFDEVK